MAKPSKTEELCCALCAHARKRSRDLICYVDPPREYLHDDMTYQVRRGVDIEPSAPPCRFFHPRENA